MSKMQSFLGGVILTLLMCSSASAYEYNGEHWQSTFNWFMGDGCPDYVEQTVINALEDFSPVPHAFGGYLHKAPGADGYTTVYCAPAPVLELQFLPPGVSYDEQDTVLANAKWWWITQTQEITECDIWLGTDSLTRYNVVRLVKHELGHCFGLQHSEMNVAIMYSSPLFNRLHVDDLMGLSELYEQCFPVVDEWNNLFIPIVRARGTYYRLLQDEDGAWPWDIYDYWEVAECK